MSDYPFESWKVIIILLLVLAGWCQSRPYPNRWVLVRKGLTSDKDVEFIRNIVKTGAAHGINGMVFGANLDRIGLQPPEYLARLEEVKRICDEYQVEVIPKVFSVGYASAVMAHNRNLAAGIPVKDALFVVKNGKAILTADPVVRVANGGFENAKRNLPDSFRVSSGAGKVLIDHRNAGSGKNSLRFVALASTELIKDSQGRNHYKTLTTRISQAIKVHPFRSYRLSCLVKTNDPNLLDTFKIYVSRPDTDEWSTRLGQVVVWDANVQGVGKWRKAVVGFNSLDCDRVKIHLGVATNSLNGKSGQFWIDDVRVEEVGFENILRRPGTPFTVKNEKSGDIYREGQDFVLANEPELDFDFKIEHRTPVLTLLPNSRIKNGDKLRVSYFYYKAMTKKGQVATCMSEPELYDIWQREIRLVEKYLAPKKYFLPLDEIRAGGTCQTCSERNLSMAQILGDCISKTIRIIRNVNTDAEIYAWSDMFDPNHNAHANYGLAGDFTNSWHYIPGDLIIVCWYYSKRKESLKFFSSLGFRTMAASYYDADNLDNTKGWLRALDETKGALGIMYTTWQNKYELLAAFGDLIMGN